MEIEWGNFGFVGSAGVPKAKSSWTVVSIECRRVGLCQG